MLFGQEQRGAALGVADAERAIETESIDHREDVVGESLPFEGAIHWCGRVAVGAHVDRPAVISGEVGGEWFPHPTVEAGGMDEDEWRTITPEVVDLQLDAIGGTHSHPSILPLRCG